MIDLSKATCELKICVMQKVYLLLRNNRQSGPFSIDELWQQNLRATDMVWIEGKSTAWAYLSELELKPTVSDEKPVATMPGRRVDDIEWKAEQLRKQALTYQPVAKPNIIPREPVKVKESTGENDTEPESIDFVDHRKDRRSILGEVLMTAVIIGIFAGGLYGGRTLFFNQSGVASPVVTKMNTTDQHHANKREIPVNEFDQINNVETTEPSIDSNILAALPQPKNNTARSTTPSTQPATKIDSNEVAIHQPTTEKQAEPVLPPVVKTTEADSTKNEKSKTEPEAGVTEETEKKKSLGQAIKGLFKKKKKQTDNNTETKEEKENKE